MTGLSQDLGRISTILRDIHRLFDVVSRRRRLQIGALLVLQVAAAISEVVSLGALVPFIAVLTDVSRYFNHPNFRIVIDILGLENEFQLIAALSTAFAASFVLVNGLRLLTMWVQTRLSAAIGSDVSIELFRRMMHQEFEYYAGQNSSDFVSTATNDFNTTMAVAMGALMIVTQGLAVFAIVSALFAFDPVIALVMTSLTGTMYVMTNRTDQKRLVSIGHIRSSDYARIVRVTQEGIGGIRDLLLGRSQSTFIDQYAEFDRRFRMAGARSMFLVSVPRYAMETFGVVTLTAVAASMALLRGDIFGVLPTIGGLAMAANRLLPALQQIYASYSVLQATHVSARRTLEDLERPLDPLSTLDAPALTPPKRSIALKDIWFRYGGQQTEEVGRDWVLQGVSLEIPVNRTIALVGATGSGKSTIADILLGLLRPQKGELMLDGTPLDDATLSAWRRMVACVPQSVFLSDTSIAENIAFGCRPDEIDQNLVERAGKSAWVSEFVDKIPKRYAEIIGERGIRLSGGQRQRIGIARALYRDAPFIVFDEATSSLDNATESAVMEAIRGLQGQRTIVLIAHRLSTVQDANIIFHIDQGRVVGQGTFRELMESSEAFRRLVAAGEQLDGDQSQGVPETGLKPSASQAEVSDV